MSDHPAIRENNTMTEAELLLRAREAYIATKRPPRIVARCIRRGWADRLVRPAITALRDINRPLWLILEERDGATAAIILRTMPAFDQMSEDDRRGISLAIMTAIRWGRRN